MVGLKFWKMHGLGNDYIVIDNMENILSEKEKTSLAVKLCRRKFSVGADGLILIEKSFVADVKMRIFNSDGSEAEMCGNGIRCLAKYCYENGIVPKKEFNVETSAGVRKVWLTINGEGLVKSVRVDMGFPAFEKEKIPMVGSGLCINEKLKIGGQEFKITCLSLGNPHCVIFLGNVEDFPVERFGPLIEKHRFFPKGVNIEFVEVLNMGELKVRVWERGVGETFACGTGACASVVAGKILGKVSEKAVVHLIGGDLKVEYSGKVFLEGFVEKVFEGFLP